jgi:hypothetical protein
VITAETQTSPPPFELSYDEQNRVTLKRPGEGDATDVRIRRSFPWSEPGKYISIRNSDGKELLMVHDLASLDVDRRSFIERELARGSFVPRIIKIDDIDTRYGLQKWTVQTDRGPAEFRVQEREDIRFLNDGRFRIKDADGNVYEMAKFDELDAESQKNLEPLI